MSGDDDTLTATCPCCRSTVTFREVDAMPLETETYAPAPGTLTPYSLGVLLHYYTTPEPHAHERHFGTGSHGLFEQVCAAFVQAGVLAANPRQDREGRYAVTEKGEAYVRAILLTPVPDPYWQPTPNIWD